MRMLVIVLLVSCMEQDPATLSGAHDQLRWFKTPEEIQETLRKSFCLNISPLDVQDYISDIGPLYGSPNINTTKTELQQPNGVYLLALDVVATWISEQLLKEQLTRERDGNPSTCANPNDDADNNIYLFNGNRYTHHSDDDSCYADDSKDWCNYQDNITLGEFHKSDLTKKQRKRIMHNIQDISDFLGLSVDNELKVSGGRHAAQMLLDDVFIPNLHSQDDDASCSPSTSDDNDVYGGDSDGYNSSDNQTLYCDYDAWQQVIHAMLLSGEFFLRLN